jgi:hypothetical protein
MELSTILELCESHMSEGDYLEASKLLKNVYTQIKKEDTDFEYIRSVETGFRITNVDRYDMPFHADDRCELRLDMKYIGRQGYDFDRYKFFFNGKTYIVKRHKLFVYLRRHFTLNLYNHIKLANEDETINVFNFRKFSKFHKERWECHDEDYDGNHDECCEQTDVNVFYNEFIEYSVKMIIEFLEEIK